MRGIRGDDEGAGTSLAAGAGVLPFSVVAGARSGSATTSPSPRPRAPAAAVAIVVSVPSAARVARAADVAAMTFHPLPFQISARRGGAPSSCALVGALMDPAVERMAWSRGENRQTTTATGRQQYSSASRDREKKGDKLANLGMDDRTPPGKQTSSSGCLGVGSEPHRGNQRPTSLPQNTSEKKCRGK